jgi:hypothetical protein
MRLDALGQGTLDGLPLRRSQLSLAIGRFGEPGLQQQDLPAVARDPLPSDLERDMAQLSSHFAGIVVIARNRQDRHAQPAEQQIDRAVGRGLVVDDVARQQHGVDGEEMALGVRETGLQPRQRARPPQRRVRVLHQVRIRELDQADAAHARGRVVR